MKRARQAGLVLLGIFLVAFALIGVLSVFRGTPVSRVLAGAPGGERASVADSLFPEIVGVLTGTALAPGHRVEVLNNGDETYPALWRDLRAARRSITVQMYYAQPGRVADSLSAILRERAGAGVRAYFLFDAFGGQKLTAGYLDTLRAGGVEVAEFRPMRWYTIDRFQHRSHVRAVVVDGQTGYTGGFGLDDKWLGDGRSPEQWRDTNVRFQGPAVMQLQSAFLAAWAEATGTLLSGELVFPPHGFHPDGSRVAGVLFATPSIGSTPAERFLALSITGADRTLYIANSYFVPDDDLTRLLAQAARRGVDVRILVPGEQTDVMVVHYAGRSRFETLLEAGVRIFEYQPSMMHAKTFVVDGVWATVGGMNFDNRSVALNDESNLLVHDAALGAELERDFLLDLRHAREVRLEEFRDRPLHHRFLEWSSALLSSLL